jgi:glycosyltransferase involved in cell wall biosynthesis
VLLFVDDASSDRSVDVLRTAAQRHPQVAVLTLKRNAGQHAALAAGIDSANPGSILVTLDADLQDPPEAIPQLVAAVEQGAGVAWARRRGRYDRAGRMLTSLLHKELLSLLAPGKHHLRTGTYCAFSPEVAEAVRKHPRRALSIPTTLACAAGSARLIDVPRLPRTEGKSGYSAIDRIGHGMATLRVARGGRRSTSPARTTPYEIGERIGWVRA